MSYRSWWHFIDSVTGRFAANQSCTVWCNLRENAWEFDYIDDKYKLLYVLPDIPLCFAEYYGVEPNPGDRIESHIVKAVKYCIGRRKYVWDEDYFDN